MPDDISIVNLTSQRLESVLPELVAIDGRTIAGDTWVESNFRHQAPEKWNLSFVALHQEMPVGFLVGSRRDNGNAHIHRLAVDVRQQKQGIGRRLIEKITQQAIALGCPAVSLKVAQDNAAAVDFYLDLGFEKNNSEGINLWMIKKI